MTTKTKPSANYSFRFAPHLDAVTRLDIEERAAAVRVAKPRARRASSDVYERRGATHLAESDAPPPSNRSTCFVRIYYRSAGGEVLAFDTAALTSSESLRVISDLRGSDALGWTRHTEKGVEWGVSTITAREARRVVLPSQRTEAVQVIADEDETFCGAYAAAAA